MAPGVGVEKARAALMPIRNDRRVPMMQIYAMFRGQLEPAGVLKAAAAGTPSKEARRERRGAQRGIGCTITAAGREAAISCTRSPRDP
jgi:hypothetical protein